MARPKQNATRDNIEFRLFKVFLSQASSPFDPTENSFHPSFPRDPALLQEIIHALLLRIENKTGGKEEADTLFRKIAFIHTLNQHLHELRSDRQETLADFDNISEAGDLINDYLFDLARGSTRQTHFSLVVKIQSLWLDIVLGEKFPSTANNPLTQLEWLKAKAGYLCETLTAMPCFCTYNPDISSSFSLGKTRKPLTVAQAKYLFLSKLHNSSPSYITNLCKNPQGHLKNIHEPGQLHPWHRLLETF